MLDLRTASPPAVDRALTILEAVARSNRGLRLPEIALRLGIPKSSAHSILVALERRGYLQRNSSGRYLFGPKIFTLANIALSQMTLREAALPVLKALMNGTGVAAKMAILDRNQAVLIEQVHPPRGAAPMTWPGKRLELHCTALGKALTAFQPSDQWKRLIAEHTLPRHNDNTICSPDRLLRELALTRERGFAFDNEEFDLGFRCLAVPVFGAANEPLAAIGLTGTVFEIHDGNMASLVKQLSFAAATIREAFDSANREKGAADNLLRRRAG
ncbi:MAG TPA: IclR family transcriptional regulator [Bryobacteraceae bacterium]|nr:IclR family transcriptional regulator [Bryobacteraceae bacterium]HPU73818.1 IclR family transcriptional regulator [Bryobacteraceae bacterium]